MNERKRGRGRPKKSITLQGVNYSSVYKAAEKLDLPVTTIRGRLRLANFKKRDFIDIEIGGKLFDSIDKAAKEFDVHRNFIRDCIKLKLIKSTVDRSIDDIV